MGRGNSTDRQTHTRTCRLSDQVGENTLQLARSGYQDTKIFATKVWGGSLDFNIVPFQMFSWIWEIWRLAITLGSRPSVAQTVHQTPCLLIYPFPPNLQNNFTTKNAMEPKFGENVHLPPFVTCPESIETYPKGRQICPSKIR